MSEPAAAVPTPNAPGTPAVPAVPGAPAAPGAPGVPGGLLTIQEFARLKLVVGVVKSAEDHPNASKLLVLKVDLGEGRERTLVAGIKGHYAPGDLVGKKVVVLANLQPAKLRGVESEGMILAATEGPKPAATRVVLLTLDRDLPVGSPVS